MADNWYIRTDADSIVVHGFSDDFERPLEGDILLTAQNASALGIPIGGRIFNAAFTDQRGRPLYKWSEGALVARTVEELADDLIPKYATQQPSLSRIGDAPAYNGHDAVVQVVLRWGETLLNGKYRYTEMQKSVKLPSDILPGMAAVDEYLATIQETLLAGAQAVHAQLASMEAV